MIPAKYYLKLLDRSVRVGGIIVLSIGVAVLVGWVADIPLLKTVFPGLASMKANTAIGFVSAATSLLLLRTSQPGSPSRRLARALSIFVAVLGGLTLVEVLSKLDFGIDELVLTDPTEASAYAGRMAPISALNFVLSGLALLALKVKRPRIANWANWLASLAIFLSGLAIVGYAYGVSSLYGIFPFSSMALHTALGFLVLSLAVLAANPTLGIANLLASDSAGGVVARRLLPTIPLALFFLGWVRLLGQNAGLYDTRFGLALMVLMSIAVSVYSISATALALRKLDLTRKRAEAEIVDLNIGLEKRVGERTAELAVLSADLSTANTELEALSLHDALTGLANRRYLDGYLATQIAVGRRQKRPLALVLCDVDSFKEYNDNEGHQAGDGVLVQIADALLKCCRRPADMAARYGGDEFLLILPDTDRVGASLMAEAARMAIERLGIPHHYSTVAPIVTISGGVSALVDEVKTAGQLIRAADQMLYEAKRLGRNRIVGDETPPLLEKARV
jgi:diguanylate cyclase (GGDEF)-like protein